MPAVSPSPWGPKPQFLLSSGLPAVGYKLFAYIAGSVGTKTDTYTNSTGVFANTNPLILDVNGQPTGEWWWDSSLTYKIVFAPAADTDPPTSPIWTVDNVRGIGAATITPSEWVASSLVPTFISTSSFSLTGDQTSTFHVGRRVRTTNSSGFIYSTITGSAFGTVTTITLDNDSGVLDSGLIAVAYGIISAVNSSDPFEVSGSGDVVGPASSTDGHFATYNGATGKLIKDVIALDTDGTLVTNSDTRVASQKATKTYVDAHTGTGDVVGPAGAIDSNFAQFNGVTGKLIKGGLALSTDGTLAANSDTNVPSQKAVKTYVDASGGSTSLAVGTTPITSGTAGRVLFEGAGNVLSEDAGLTYNATTDALTTTTVTLGTVSSATGAIKLANASSANLTTLQAGNALAARTYTWPTDFGASGTVLTDAAGNGTLSWAAAGGGSSTSITGTTGAAGGNATATGGTSTTSGNAGGQAVIVGGTPGATGVGGAVTITGGVGGTSSGAGGAVSIQGGANTNGRGGFVNILGGTSTGANFGSNIVVTAGQASGANTGGTVTITGGAAGAANSDGGPAQITGGLGAGAGTGGAVTLTAGAGGVFSGSGGNVAILGGPGGVTAGNGGNVNLRPGVPVGAGVAGNIQLDGGRGAALATTATGGFVTIPTCAGTPTATPANVPTGSVAMVFDTTGSKLWIFTSSAWKGVVVA